MRGDGPNGEVNNSTMKRKSQQVQSRTDTSEGRRQDVSKKGENLRTSRTDKVSEQRISLFETRPKRRVDSNLRGSLRLYFVPVKI